MQNHTNMSKSNLKHTKHVKIKQLCQNYSRNILNICKGEKAHLTIGYFYNLDNDPLNIFKK
jgi:hypothetical protein